jgi:hypothetical protein
MTNLIKSLVVETLSHRLISVNIWRACTLVGNSDEFDIVAPAVEVALLELVALMFADDVRSVKGASGGAVVSHTRYYERKT